MGPHHTDRGFQAGVGLNPSHAHAVRRAGTRQSFRRPERRLLRRQPVVLARATRRSRGLAQRKVAHAHISGCLCALLPHPRRIWPHQLGSPHHRLDLQRRHRQHPCFCLPRTEPEPPRGCSATGAYRGVACRRRAVDHGTRHRWLTHAHQRRRDPRDRCRGVDRNQQHHLPSPVRDRLHRLRHRALRRSRGRQRPRARRS